MPFQPINLEKFETLVNDFTKTRKEIRGKMRGTLNVSREEKMQIEKQNQPVVDEIKKLNDKITTTESTPTPTPEGGPIPQLQLPTSDSVNENYIANVITYLRSQTRVRSTTELFYNKKDDHVTLGSQKNTTEVDFTDQNRIMFSKDGSTMEVDLSPHLVYLLVDKATDLTLMGQMNGDSISRETIIQYMDILHFSKISASAFNKINTKFQYIFGKLNLSKEEWFESKKRTIILQDPPPPTPTPRTPPPRPTAVAPTAVAPTAVTVEGSGIKRLYYDINEAVPRLEVLLGSIKSGNSSKQLLNEVSDILHLLVSNKLITQKIHKEIIHSILPKRGRGRPAGAKNKLRKY